MMSEMPASSRIITISAALSPLLIIKSEARVAKKGAEPFAAVF
jgi:hypothetical protein